MGSEDNRKRAKWQDYSGSNAGVAEKSFYEVFKELFKGTNFKIRPNPQEFKNLYLGVELDKDVLIENGMNETDEIKEKIKKELNELALKKEKEFVFVFNPKKEETKEKIDKSKLVIYLKDGD